ncbi:MAG: HIRAN protein [Hydrogenophilales bacterium CG_4_9_14_3_um_filter_59_35]|nr:MAG: HIRAN protein [Hydrogenophilales bacterium CG18_big_fil_WC_8_21_14_2_50_58_12]PIX98605.1 MAG: HIRAN protein [Hydrogenophilales bacterium CG_4_10_14_3_um_filter_58_23]PJB04972.1 MAG: HIRAN protein [Hydrogenophilales bacterium CG_4_9_14_3_um_filter_59_35]
MSRRAFLNSLTGLIGCFALPAATQASIRSGTWKTLQTSPLAGFQYHSGETLWSQLATGQRLTLTREADNRFDDRAVRVDWQGRKLGYIPRMDNAAIAQLLDRGETLEAAIAWLESGNNSCNRVRVEVRWRV